MAWVSRDHLHDIELIASNLNFCLSDCGCTAPVRLVSEILDRSPLMFILPVTWLAVCSAPEGKRMRDTFKFRNAHLCCLLELSVLDRIPLPCIAACTTRRVQTQALQVSLKAFQEFLTKDIAANVQVGNGHSTEYARSQCPLVLTCFLLPADPSTPPKCRGQSCT